MPETCAGQLRTKLTSPAARADLLNTRWNFCPSTAAAWLFCILFALTTCAHLVQGIWHRKSYCWVIVCSGALQTVNYVFRIISIKNPTSLGDYAAWFIAPVFTNGFVYMVMGGFASPSASSILKEALLICGLGRMVWNYVPDATIYRVTAWRFSTYFVVLDIIALIIQVIGAASAANSKSPKSHVLTAIHVYMGGVAFQQFFILVFAIFALRFHRTVLHQRRQGVPGAASALPLLYAIYAVLLLITIRIVFRLCEYSQGLDSSIPSHEVYQYCLDSLPMLVALLILNVFHPGRVMPGAKSDIPSRKVRKAEGHQIPL
ncbi:Sphingoid long-chain base transporter RSB1 [Lachnellula cervina]|uniref:Sphingoid long-chain base transporter RSB1 n=1 Tax=Lachnellula cervina TaxID=1316786 RepID=A0A7D8UXK2_9HELO|nr:Sphingoid long-chain base transporter RSB1 [Lachnellula cervina]